MKRKLTGSLRIAILRECCASQTVVETVDEGIIQRPDVTHGESFRMVPGGQRRSVGEALNVVAGVLQSELKYTARVTSVVLVIATNEQCLAAGQIEVERPM
jgi:hypothetical protein